MPDAFASVPASRGHFLLESGYHTDRWLDLDALFVDPAAIAPMISLLADRLRTHRVSAVCGPLLGGAFLAHAIATVLCVNFYYTAPDLTGAQSGLFGARYRLPGQLRRRMDGERVAITDDVMSAGSSVRATSAAVESAGGTVVVIGALAALGDAGVDYFRERGIAVETLERHQLSLWKPDSCPLCGEGLPLVDPREAS